MRSAIASAPHLVGLMTLSTADRSIQRTIIVCLAFALLALPLAGTLHCEVLHAEDRHAPAPLAEACCVFLCLTMLVGMVVIQLNWLSIIHVTFDLKPVRLTNRPTRWVPPPRSIGLLSVWLVSLYPLKSTDCRRSSTLRPDRSEIPFHQETVSLRVGSCWRSF